MSKSAALLLTENGDLHLYCDEMYVERLQTGLPVGEPLYGGVDVLGCHMQIKSEILSWPDPSNPFRNLQTKLLMHFIIID